MLNKKGQLNTGILFGVIFLAAALVVGGIFMAFGADVVNDVSADFTANSYAANISTATLEGIDTVAQKQDTLGTIGVVTIILGLLIGVVGSVFAIKQYM